MEDKKCKHQNHQTEALNNGMVWCTSCGAIDLYHYRVRDEKEQIVFEGNIWECEEWMAKEENEYYRKLHELRNIIKKTAIELLTKHRNFGTK
jgi:RNase P subunit RPR2